MHACMHILLVTFVHSSASIEEAVLDLLFYDFSHVRASVSVQEVVLHNLAPCFHAPMRPGEARSIRFVWFHAKEFTKAP